MKSNKREIILDFTSLLDVIMIILFFFILFSKLQFEKNFIAEHEAEYNIKMENAERLEKEAEEKLAEAEEMLEQLRNSEADSDRNAGALAELVRGDNINIKLTVEGSYKWKMTLSNKTSEITVERANTGTAVTQDEIGKYAKQITDFVGSLGYGEDTVSICTLIFNSDDPGSNKAYNECRLVFDEARKKYRDLFLNVVDISEGE